MSEHRALIAFHSGDVRSDRDEVCTAEFIGCDSLRMGFPNDEAQQGHPLSAHGLEFYRLHEVANSSWLSDLRAVEAVHPYAPARPFADRRHFVLTFHDSMVEAIAESIVVGPSYVTMDQAIDALAARLKS